MLRPTPHLILCQFSTIMLLLLICPVNAACLFLTNTHCDKPFKKLVDLDVDIFRATAKKFKEYVVWNPCHKIYEVEAVGLSISVNTKYACVIELLFQWKTWLKHCTLYTYIAVIANFSGMCYKTFHMLIVEFFSLWRLPQFTPIYPSTPLSVTWHDRLGRIYEKLPKKV